MGLAEGFKFVDRTKTRAASGGSMAPFRQLLYQGTQHRVGEGGAIFLFLCSTRKVNLVIAFQGLTTFTREQCLGKS